MTQNDPPMDESGSGRGGSGVNVVDGPVGVRPRPAPIIPRQDRGPERCAEAVSAMGRPAVAPWEVPVLPPRSPARPGRASVWAVVAFAVLLVGTVMVARSAPARAPEAAPRTTPSRCVHGARVVPCPLTPARLRTAYNVTPVLAEGVDGSGRTVTLIEFPPSATTPAVGDIHDDLAAYDRAFHLPPASLSVDSRLAPAAAPGLANAEEVMDAEIVHAIAPGAHIQVVRTEPARLYEALARSEDHPLGDVVSLSLGAGERCGTPANLAAVHRILARVASAGTTIVASSGDSGAATVSCIHARPDGPVADVQIPASDPLVTAVGGTRLRVTPSGRRVGETAWNSPEGWGTSGPSLMADPFGGAAHSVGSGGGFSRRFPRPDYQAGVVAVGGGRGVPDVAADADPNTGVVAVYVAQGRSRVFLAGGTSAGAPLWAGLVALADQQAGRRLGSINPALYRIARSTAYHQAFHDVTVGDNNATTPRGPVPGYRAGPGWDPVTGWGTPDVARLVPELVKTGP